METVLYEVQKSVAVITFNRPQVLNAFDEQMHEEFYAALRQAQDDAAVRAVVIKGNGRGFSAGADLNALKQADASVDVGEHLRKTYNKSITLMSEMTKPIVASIQGPAHGAGLGVALACDFRLASRSANFGLAFIKIGLMPDAGVDYFLPRIVGLSRALELAAFGETIDSEKALQIGLVNRVTTDEELEQETIKFSQRLANLPTRAFGFMKQTMLQSFESNLSSTLEREANGQSNCARSKDHREGVMAFYEKRRANFTGE